MSISGTARAAERYGAPAKTWVKNGSGQEEFRGKGMGRLSRVCGAKEFKNRQLKPWPEGRGGL